MKFANILKSSKHIWVAMLLRIEQGSIYYGRVAAVRAVDIATAENSTVAIIGANGAGKTTLLRAISGLKGIHEGKVWFGDKRIDGMRPEEVVALGIAHVPEGRRIFPDMTTEENLRLGAYLRRDNESINADLKNLYARFPRLGERKKQMAKTMSGGEQQMLAIGRALMSKPCLLLLDEPSIGLSPIMVKQIADIIHEVRQQGVSVILVEQNADMALRLSDYGYVLETGGVALHGTGEMLRGNEHVRRAYLGG